MRPEATVLRHNAFVYDTEAEYLATAVAFLQEGLRLGQGAVVANERNGIGAIREALGDQAAQVRFVDVSAAYTRPAKTLAAYHQVYAEELSRFPSLRAVADVQYGPNPGEWELWNGYESVFNQSFAHLPAWVLCSYKTADLPDPVRDGIWRTHPEVVSGGTWNDSASYDSRDEPFVNTSRPAPLEQAASIPVAEVAHDVEAMRASLVRALVAQGLPDGRVVETLLATTEVLANAVSHGGGVAAIRVGRVGGRRVWEVVDRGPGFEDPTAGYLAPRTGRGSGLWVARQLTWDLEFFRSPEGFVARATA
jgi:anti-sigma regulatory factor (Ser/Thr protein kinase)